MKNSRFNTSSKRNSAEVFAAQRVLSLVKARKGFKMIFLLNLPHVARFAPPVCNGPIRNLQIPRPPLFRLVQPFGLHDTFTRPFKPGKFRPHPGLYRHMKASKGFPSFFPNVALQSCHRGGAVTAADASGLLDPKLTRNIKKPTFWGIHPISA